MNTIPPQMRILEMLGGFQISQVLYVLAKLDIPTMLRQGPRTIGELAAATEVDAGALGRVVHFAASLGLFRTDGDRVEVTELGAVLAEDHPRSMRWPAFYYMETHYAPFGDFLETVRTGESTSMRFFGKSFWDWVSDSPDRAELQNRTFENVTRSLRAGMFDRYRLPAGAVVADLGGADGSILAELLSDEPDRRGIVFDRPDIVPAARRNLADRGMDDRVRTEAGDFFRSVPGADVYILADTLHDWDDESCRTILRNIAAAANPGARVVLIEAVVPPGDTPHPAKAIDIVMLAMTEGGRERTAYEWQALLESAGFALDRIVESVAMYSFIEATL
jgi:hypothetical protein